MKPFKVVDTYGQESIIMAKGMAHAGTLIHRNGLPGIYLVTNERTSIYFIDYGKRNVPLRPVGSFTARHFAIKQGLTLQPFCGTTVPNEET